MSENCDKCNQIILEGPDALYCDRGAHSKCLKISKKLEKSWFCELNSKEQQELNNDGIVQGIPSKASKKLYNLVKKLAETLHVPNNIELSFRIGE